MNNLNKEICAACKGSCCKNIPGLFSPSDFENKITIELIYDLVQNKNCAIDWWESSKELGQTFYLRPQTVSKKKIDPSWGGTCINLTEVGCSLGDEERPYMCRMLMPEKKKLCSYPKGITKYNVVLEWVPYQEVFQTVIDKIQNGI